MLAGFDTGLYRADGRGGFVRFLGAWASQGMDLRSGGRVAQLSCGLELDLFPVHARMGAAHAWRQGSLAELDGSLRLYDRRGDSLRLSYLYLPSADDAEGRPLPLSERTQREIGLLFGAQPLPLRGLGDGLHVLGINAALALHWGCRATGGVHLNLRETGIEMLNWYGAGLAYRSDCRCWGFSVSFRKLQGQKYPDVFFLLDLGLLGRAGGGTATRF